MTINTISDQIEYNPKFYKNSWVGMHIECLQGLINRLVTLAQQGPGELKAEVEGALCAIDAGLGNQGMKSLDFSAIELKDRRARLYFDSLVEACQGEDPPLPTHQLDGEGRPFQQISEEDTQTMRTILLKEATSKVKDALRQLSALTNADSEEAPAGKRAKGQEKARTRQRRRVILEIPEETVKKLREVYGVTLDELDDYEMDGDFLNDIFERIRSDQKLCPFDIDRDTIEYNRFEFKLVSSIAHYGNGSSAFEDLEHRSPEVKMKISSNKAFLEGLIYLYGEINGILRLATDQVRGEIAGDKHFISMLIMNRPSEMQEILAAANAEVREEIRGDKAFIMERMCEESSEMQEILAAANAEVREEIQGDKECIIELIREKPCEAQEILAIASAQVREAIQSDKECIMQIIQEEPYAIRWILAAANASVREEIRVDREFLEKLMREKPYAMQALVNAGVL